MSIMLICNLGVRDLLLDNERISPPREKGKKILEDFNKYCPRLSYPIVRPVFDYIFQDKKHEKIDRLILIATDQDEKFTKPEHRASDTIEFARIIQRIVEKHYGERKIAQIKIAKIPQNPNFLDEMYDFFGKALDNNKSFQMDDLKVCYVEQAGGIPSANMAVLFQCINKFKDKCSAIYVSEKTKAAHPIRIADDILGEHRKSLFLELAKKFDYAMLCDHLDDKKDDEKFLHRLLQYAQHRLYFDISTAQSIARQAIGEFLSLERNIFEDLFIDLEKIEQRDYASLIIELFHNMVIKYLRHEFVDFVGRAYRFKEAVLRYLIELNFGVSTEIDQKSGRPTDFFQWIESNDDVKQFVSSEKTPDGAKVDPLTFGLPLLMACLKYLIVKKSKKNCQQIYEILRKFDILIALRNQSIIGHGFDGVSEELIKARYDGKVVDDLKRLIETICKIHNLQKPENPFEKINGILTKKIKGLH